METKRGSEQIWDVVVIGGGPAGMMAAATASAQGRKVLLLEKNPSLGKKLLITGGGRCNVTNNKPDIRTMQAEYKGAGKFLFSLFAQHGVTETINWFNERGVTLKEENEGRLFPTTDSARTIFETLVTELKKTGVTVKIKQTVHTITRQKKTNLFTITTESATYTAQACIVASGGTSRPETGATGDGYPWLKKLGHTIEANSFALVPVSLKNSWLKKVAGITLSHISFTIWADGKKHSVHPGKLLFTHVGVTGPTVLNASKTIGELLTHSSVVLTLDLFPTQDTGALKQQLQDVFLTHSNKKLKNALALLLPSALVGGILSELEVNGEVACHSVSTEQRKKLVQALKALPLVVKGLLGEDKAVVSAGGVALTEISTKTMASTIVPNLYIIGDLLAIDRPSGGYSLQLCWSTGFVAGLHAASVTEKS